MIDVPLIDDCCLACGKKAHKGKCVIGRGPTNLQHCRNCKTLVTSRAGRGLCRTCWDKPNVRSKFKPLMERPNFLREKP